MVSGVGSRRQFNLWAWSWLLPCRCLWVHRPVVDGERDIGQAYHSRNRVAIDAVVRCDFKRVSRQARPGNVALTIVVNASAMLPVAHLIMFHVL